MLKLYSNNCLPITSCVYVFTGVFYFITGDLRCAHLLSSKTSKSKDTGQTMKTEKKNLMFTYNL